MSPTVPSIFTWIAGIVCIRIFENTRDVVLLRETEATGLACKLSSVVCGLLFLYFGLKFGLETITLAMAANSAADNQRKDDTLPPPTSNKTECRASPLLPIRLSKPFANLKRGAIIWSIVFILCVESFSSAAHYLQTNFVDEMTPSVPMELFMKLNFVSVFAGMHKILTHYFIADRTTPVDWTLWCFRVKPLYIPALVCTAAQIGVVKCVAWSLNVSKAEDTVSSDIVGFLLPPLVGFDLAFICLLPTGIALTRMEAALLPPNVESIVPVYRLEEATDDRKITYKKCFELYWSVLSGIAKGDLIRVALVCIKVSIPLAILLTGALAQRTSSGSQWSMAPWSVSI